MKELAVGTAVYLSPEEVYDFLVDFPRYARYSKHLESVRTVASEPEPRYALRFAWWKLSYTVQSAVTDTERPTRIEWRLVEGLTARGRWLIEPLSALPEGAPPGADEACQVRFEVEYDPQTVGEGSLDLPRFVSLGWVIDKVTPLVVGEAERVVERVVADLEGTQRPVELTVEHETTRGA